MLTEWFTFLQPRLDDAKLDIHGSLTLTVINYIKLSKKLTIPVCVNESV